MNETMLQRNYLFSVLCAICIFGLSACVSNQINSTPIQTIIVGNNIITMDSSNAGANAVALSGGKIVAVGDKSKIMKMQRSDTRIIELGDRALLPGFIDTHGHIAATARFIDFVNLSSPPVGTADNIDDIVQILQTSLENDPPKPGEWLIGYGYDDSLLSEKRHPTRDDLDQISAEIPIYIAHVSGHLGVLNSAALEQSGLTAATPDPEGGVIRRRKNSSEPNGVLEETAVTAVLYGVLAKTSAEEFERMISRSIDYYASHGITTVQDGAASPFDIAGFRKLAAKRPLAIDVAAFRYAKPTETKIIEAFIPEPDYVNGYRVAGIKFSLDGSPQGRTAWLTSPYNELPADATTDYVAYPTVDTDTFISAATTLLRKDVPMLVHTNGDAAVDLLIRGLEHGIADGIKRDNRTVAIHAQLMRADQLDQANRLGIVPSFFSAHTFFWGDWHLKSFGEQRGNNISPTRWASEKGVPFTVHNDTPVVPPDMMRLLWATVNRETRSGKTIGPQHRLNVMEALAGMTSTAAYQYFEEDKKGTISVGKQADLVILDADPIKVDPNTIKDIKIVETFARGKSVYKSETP